MSCETVNVIKGQDCTFKIKTANQNGALFDPSVFDKLIIVVYHANGTQIAKFSKNVPATGYLPIDMSNAALFEVSVMILSTHTNAASEGKLLYEIHGQYAEAAATDDSVLDLISTNNYLCTIIKSVTGTTTLP